MCAKKNSVKRPAFFKVLAVDYAAHLARKKLGKQEMLPLLPFDFRAMAVEQGLGDDLRELSAGEQFQTFASFDEAHNLTMDRLELAQQKSVNISEELRKALAGRLTSLVSRNRARGLVEQEKLELKRLNKNMGKMKRAGATHESSGSKKS